MILNKFLSKLTYLIGGTRLNYSLRYFHQRMHFPDFDNPKDLSERILASMLSPDFMKYAPYTDKIKVRDYVQKKGLSHILLRHYGIWDNPEEIDFSELPDKFALKTNNGCGNHIFCKDKRELNEKQAIQKLKRNLTNYHSVDLNIEPHYRLIKPKVYCEELIDTGSDSWPIDYKFTCIKGEPFDIFVASEREKKVRYSTFDLNWEMLPYTRKKFMPESSPPKPNNLEEMINIAKILSEDFDFVRVDLYEHKEKIFFSELTFSPWGGIMYSYTNEALVYLGNKFV
jgi:hypothetical protein